MLYHTLFESHMIYCCSVFGGIAKNHTDIIFRIQKHCVRILFGDREGYLKKSRTCARVREYNKQHLGLEYYKKENTKPLFHKNKILAFKNCYSYHTCLEIFKFLKFKVPRQIFEKLGLSKRNNEMLHDQKYDATRQLKFLSIH